MLCIFLSCDKSPSLSFVLIIAVMVVPVDVSSTTFDVELKGSHFSFVSTSKKKSQPSVCKKNFAVAGRKDKIVCSL